MKKILFYLIAITIAVSSCTIGKQITEPKIEYRDRIVNNTSVDSIYFYSHDTTYIKKSNDTVFITKLQKDIKYKYKLINKTDTVKVNTIQTEYKDKIIYKHDKIWWIGLILIFSSGLYLIVKSLQFFRIIPKFTKKGII